MPDSVNYRDLVRGAVEICGDKKTLAALLNVTVDQVTSWVEGRTALPAHLYPPVVEIIVAYERERLPSRKPTDGD
jgi:hypothetical protein